jgi:hypothetical protein
MATLADLKARIIAETNRDDLADDLATALDEVISRAIEFYAVQRFTFNEYRQTATTVANNQYVTLPAGTRMIDYLSVTVGSNAYPLRPQAASLRTIRCRRARFVSTPCQTRPIR